MYAHINSEQTIQGDLGASHAVMTNLECGNLWRETFLNKIFLSQQCILPKIQYPGGREMKADRQISLCMSPP